MPTETVATGVTGHAAPGVIGESLSGRAISVATVDPVVAAADPLLGAGLACPHAAISPAATASAGPTRIIRR
jgi:hypothetical protein